LLYTDESTRNGVVRSTFGMALGILLLFTMLPTSLGARDPVGDAGPVSEQAPRVAFAAGHASMSTLLNGPECADYDPVGDRYFISAAMDGTIIEIDSEWNERVFAGTWDMTVGLIIVDGVLYFSIGTGVVGVDLTTEQVVFEVIVPGAVMIDGLGADTSGNLYALEYFNQLVGYDRIYKINIASEAISWFVSYGLGFMSQDVLFDAPHNRLLVGGFSEHAVIQAVSLDDSSITDLVTTPAGYIDGLALDTEGHVYFGSFNEGSVYRYDSTLTNPPELVCHVRPSISNIDYDTVNNILVVPVFNSDMVEFVPMHDHDGDGVDAAMDNCPDAHNPGQEDVDGDGVGNVCDNCPDSSNGDQADGDGDLIGDACDACPSDPDNDEDGDGVCSAVDNCPVDSNASQADMDMDGVGDICDNCVDGANPNQEDNNDNGIGDVCECRIVQTGDVDESGSITSSDIISMVNYVFKGGLPLDPCEAAGDVDCTAAVTAADIIYLVNHVFKGGGVPCDACTLVPAMWTCD
jgi:hypothetical protein